MYSPQPSEEAHTLLTAYLAWKWKDVSQMSDTERGLLKTGMNLPSSDDGLCKLGLPGRPDTTPTISISSESTATKYTRFSKSPSSAVPLSKISNIQVTSCNRFGCSFPAIVRVKPPDPPSISSLRVTDISVVDSTVTINSISLNEPKGAVVTQGNKVGTLKTALSGTVTSVVITSKSSVTFDPAQVLRVGSSTIQAVGAINKGASYNIDGLQVIFRKPDKTYGADTSFYLLKLVNKAVSNNPFRVDRILDLNDIVTYDLIPGHGSESGDWLSTLDPKTTGLTVEMVSCCVLNCTVVPSTKSTGAPGAPSSVIVRKHTTDNLKITVDISDPILDGGVRISQYKVQWQAYWNCYNFPTCASYTDLLGGDLVAAGAEITGSPSAAPFTGRAGGTITEFQLPVKEWTITVNSVYIGEKMHVTVTQGASVGTLKSNLGTVCTVSIVSTSISEIQGVKVTQGTNSGILQSALSGDVTSIVIDVEPGVVFSDASVSDIDIIVGSTTVEIGTVSGVQCEETTSFVVVSNNDVSFDASTNIVVGSTEITGVTGATSASVHLPNSLRVKSTVIACNTIGCGNSYSSWNVNLQTTVSLSPTFDQFAAVKNDLQINWGTTSNKSVIASEVTNPLSTLIRLSVPYTAGVSTTLRRTSAWVFNASEPDYVSGNIVVGKDGIQKELNNNTMGYVVYEVLVLEQGTYALHVQSKCPDSASNKWKVVFNGNQPQLWSLPVSSNDRPEWSVFEGNSWEIQSPGKRIWVELQSNDENCLIISLQVGKVKPPYSRERIWPPKINTPIMREYLITPYKETHNKNNLPLVYEEPTKRRDTCTKQTNKN